MNYVIDKIIYYNKILLRSVAFCLLLVTSVNTLAETSLEKEQKRLEEWESRRKSIYNNLVDQASKNNSQRALIFEAFNDLKVTEKSFHVTQKNCTSAQEVNLKKCIDSLKKARIEAVLSKTKIDRYLESDLHKQNLSENNENYSQITDLLVQLRNNYQHGFNQLKSIHLSMSSYLLASYNKKSKADLEEISADAFCKDSEFKLRRIYRSIQRDVRKRESKPHLLFDAKVKLDNAKFILDTKQLVCKNTDIEIQIAVNEYNKFERELNNLTHRDSLLEISKILCDRTKQKLNEQMLKACAKGTYSQMFLATLSKIYEQVKSQ